MLREVKFNIAFLIICLLTAILLLIIGLRVMNEREHARPKWHEYVVCSNPDSVTVTNNPSDSAYHCWYFKSKLETAYHHNSRADK